MYVLIPKAKNIVLINLSDWSWISEMLLLVAKTFIQNYTFLGSVVLKFNRKHNEEEYNSLQNFNMQTSEIPQREFSSQSLISKAFSLLPLIIAS